MATASASRRAFAARAVPELPADVRLLDAGAIGLALVALLLVAATLLLWGSRQPVFAIRAITIDGDVARNSVATLRANAAPRLAGNFLTLDLGVAQRAFESVPWVRRAVVHRVWPNRLRVRLEEHRPVALWGGGDGQGEKLLNSFGEVFEANLGDVEDDDLPTLAGPDGSAVRMLALLGRLAAPFARLDARIERLWLSNRGSWRATLASGAVLELGRGSEDEVVARTERFVASVGEVTTRYQRPLEYADLRHSDGYAVRLKGVSTVLSPQKK